MANASIRYGASIRKRYNKIRQEKHSSYLCDVCGKDVGEEEGHEHMGVQALRHHIRRRSLLDEDGRGKRGQEAHRGNQEVNKW